MRARILTLPPGSGPAPGSKLMFGLAFALALGAGPAEAAWGPLISCSQLKVEDRSMSKLTSYEAGLVAFADDLSGMWRFTYGKAGSRKMPASLELYQAELSFPLSGMRYFVPYAGIGGALSWLRRDGRRRRAWIGQAHGGVLINPLEGIGQLGSSLPCFSCLINSSSPKCRECMFERRARPARPRAEPASRPASVYLGAEIGYRTARMMLSGWEGRAYAAVLF